VGCKGDPLSQLVFEAVGGRLAEVLKRRGRVADLCHVYPNPMARLDELDQNRKLADLPQLKARLGQPAFDQMQTAMARAFRSSVAELLAGLRAADRNADAEALKAKAIALDPSDEMKRALER
jgi:hypothetical protein